MPLEREELEAAKPTKAADRQILTGLAQAALKADAVTGDPAWDTLCSYIQRAIDVAEQQRTAQLVALASPSLAGDEKIALARTAIFRMDERIRSLKWVVTMPAEIKKVGSVAKEKLSEMEKDSASEETANAA